MENSCRSIGMSKYRILDYYAIGTRLGALVRPAVCGIIPKELPLELVVDEHAAADWYKECLAW